uniref:Uncharacterized protein n=1 Tax=viral metagenome TaxID=1070528 RepID=A0A6M3LFT4_9ZZZZ
MEVTDHDILDLVRVTVAALGHSDTPVTLGKNVIYIGSTRVEISLIKDCSCNAKNFVSLIKNKL